MKSMKRLAAVAAVAVAGPTILTATPAMAADQPAVIVPDVAPKDDAADAGTPAPALPDVQTPAPVPVPAPAVPAPAVPDVQAPAPQPAPVAESAAKDAKSDEDTQGAEADGILMGPDVTVAGIPKNGFKADGSWTSLQVTVDNGGHVAVPNYTPTLSVDGYGGTFKPSQVKVEWKTAGGTWQSAKLTQGEAFGSSLQYSFGTDPTLAKATSYTVDVRIAFAAGTTVMPFDLVSAGYSRVGNHVNYSPSAWYNAKIVGAVDDREDPFVEGPALTVNGVPETIKAGGDWTNLSVRVDNGGKEALKGFNVGLVLARPDWVKMAPSQIKVEVLSKDKNGKAGWHEAEVWSEEESVFFGIDLAGGPVAAGQSFDVQFRIRFAADAPLGAVSIFSWGSSQVGPDTPTPWADSRSRARLTTIVAASPNTGGNGNQTKPNGGAKPITDTTGNTGSTGTTGATGGELAATGSDPATTWALGGAGVALAMGAALVAGTGRRRRTTA
ncbi:hypothetical protein [Streptomyces virginiae]|uniref:hypothetical protein n=1 Tax=Streptomyces virginiae TaxID=1961 RepID=UPI00224E9891|nr:hypothetical protein [Streptomyces virginiae]MCX4958905.1 hypothetical protein [Streptomyces virginiae]